MNNTTAQTITNTPLYTKQICKFSLSISILVSLILYLLVQAMHVDGVLDVTNHISLLYRENSFCCYELSLEAFDALDDYDLKFASRGCIVTVTANGKIIYQYGVQPAKSKRSIGQTYTSIPLLQTKDTSKLVISLEGVDSDVSKSLGRVELCPHSETLRYYLTNGSFSLPTGILFFTLAICMPMLMLLYRKRIMIKIGFYISGILFCFSIVLLNSGGHYLLFFSNQEHWNSLYFLTGFFFPGFCLLYFKQIETLRVSQKLILIVTIVNFVSAIISTALGITNVIPFDVLTFIFHFILVFDAIIGTVYIFHGIRKSHTAKGQVFLLILAFIWLVFAIVHKTLSYYNLCPPFLNTIDLLTPSSVLLFFILCYTFSEMVSMAYSKKIQQETLLHRLINHERELIPYEKMAQALFFAYESLYYIDIETNHYDCYYQSEKYTEYEIPLMGNDFFHDTADNISKIIFPDDRGYVSEALTKDAVLNGVKNGNSYSLIYRILFKDEVHHFQIKAILEDNGFGHHIVLGVRNIDDMVQIQNEHALAIKKAQQIEDELRLTRVKNFNSQMQPHFLYNVLSSIQEVILSDPEYASSLIGDFTVHLRSSIRAMNGDTPIPFEEEFKNIKAYVNIEKMRLDDRLNISYDIRVWDFYVIPLSIQPLVENAIRHGIYQKGAVGGTVTIVSYERDSDIIVEVSDNGIGFDYKQVICEIEAGKRDSTGLKNLIFRLERLMGAQVDIQSKIGEGTKVTVSIPHTKALR